MNDKNNSSSIWDKVKSVFVVPKDIDLSEDVIDTLQGHTEQQIISEYDQLNNLMDRAIKGYVDDFTFTRDVVRLQELQNQRDEIEDRHHNNTSFLQNLITQLITKIPILIMLLPADSHIRQQLQSYLDELNMGLEVGFDPTDLEDKLDISNDKQKNQFLTIRRLMDDYKQQLHTTIQLVDATIQNYQDTIVDMISQLSGYEDNHIPDIVTPEEYDKQVKKTILDYKGRSTNNSDSPITDRFRAELLLEKVQEYRTWYEKVQSDRSILIQNALPIVQSTIDKYTDLVKKEVIYSIDKLTTLWSKVLPLHTQDIKVLADNYQNAITRSDVYQKDIEHKVLSYNNFLDNLNLPKGHNLIVQKLDQDILYQQHTHTSDSIQKATQHYQDSYKETISSMTIESISSIRHKTASDMLASRSLLIDQLRDDTIPLVTLRDLYNNNILAVNNMYNQFIKNHQQKQQDLLGFFDISLGYDNRLSTYTVLMYDINEQQQKITLSHIDDKILDIVGQDTDLKDGLIKLLGLDSIPSKAPRWTGKIYSDPTAPADDKTGRQSTLNRKYKGTTNTYVRLDGIEQVFQKQGIEVKDFDNGEEATPYLKEIFKDFATKFPALQKENNWFNIDNSTMYQTLLGPNGALKNIPFRGSQDSGGRWDRSGDFSSLWLPLRVKGKFVCVWSGSHGQKATFGHGYEEDAILVPSFED